MLAYIFLTGHERDEADMKILVVDGDELVADSEALGSFEAACAKFEAWVASRAA